MDFFFFKKVDSCITFICSWERREGGRGRHSSWQKRSLLFFCSSRPWNVHSQYALSTYICNKRVFSWRKQEKERFPPINWSHWTPSENLPCGSTKKQRWPQICQLGPIPHRRPCNAQQCSSWCSLRCLQTPEHRSYCQQETGWLKLAMGREVRFQ